MKSWTVFAVAVAAGVTTCAQISASHAEGRDFFQQRNIDTMTPASIGQEASESAKEAVSVSPARSAKNPHRPALTAVERSTKTKMSALPGVKKLTIKEQKQAAGSAKHSVKVKYASIVTRYAAAYGVSSDLAHAVIRIESNYRENARGSAGEIGLMQIKPATARMLGYTGSNKGLYDPATNIKFGLKYLSMAQDLGGGTTCGTILKYNAGHGATRMNPVSAAYCVKVKAALGGS